MSSFVYYLAKNPEVQRRARAEVLAAMGSGDPDMANLRKMNFVQACLRESLRINTPIVSFILNTGVGRKFKCPISRPTWFPVHQNHRLTSKHRTADRIIFLPELLLF